MLSLQRISGEKVSDNIMLQELTSFYVSVKLSSWMKMLLEVIWRLR